MVKIKEDLIGKIFGRWKVIERAEDAILKNGTKEAQWLCECSCEKHTRKIIKNSNLKNNRSFSCGCLRYEAAQKRRKTNEYIKLNDFYIGITTTNFFIIDIEDYKKVKKYCWHSDNLGYVITKINNKTISLHKFLLKTDTNEIIDHINRKPWDNRKDNLRIVTFKENIWNMSISKNNTSGFIGVYFQKGFNKWCARIRIDKKVVHLGSYENKEEAIKARLKAEKEYFGEEFAPQRHLFKEYSII